MILKQKQQQIAHIYWICSGNHYTPTPEKLGTAWRGDLVSEGVCCDRQNGWGEGGGGVDRVGTIFALYFMCNRDFSLIMR